MEFIDGPSLAGILAAGPVAPAVALDVVAQTADGLAAAHRAGLVHRDVKPGNILIGPGGRVKVTDFGIAHAAGQAPVTGPGLVMGTAQYLAPERIAGGQGTPASDLYALGIVLHECLTGVPPFEGTSAEVMAAHLYLPTPPLPAGVPAEVDALVGRLTAKDPAQRISDAGELAELAARLRGAPAPGHLVPSARGQHHGAGAAIADPVPPPIPPPSGPWRGSGLAEPAERTAPLFALSRAEGDAGGPGPGPAPIGPAAAGSAGQDTGLASAGWVLPAHMTRGNETGIFPPASRAHRNRRRGAAFAAVAAVVTGLALVVLLVNGAFRTASSNDPPPVSPTSASATTPGVRPSPHAGSASATSRAGSSAAVPGATTPRSAGRSTKASPGRSPSISPSTSPSGSPSGSPTNRPSGSPSGSPRGTPTPMPTGSSCILPGVCF
jgi:serine/threonine-protein kinase